MQEDWNPCLQTLEGYSDWVDSVAFSSDGRYLASAGAVFSVAFSSDGRYLASALSDKTVKIWEPATGRCLQTLEGYSGWVNSVAFSSDGRYLASVLGDGTVKLWELATGYCL
ncbi:WD40-repeat-containing domain protein [Coniochaeta sp. 2T2.1]|nr:WD40-repeat-containing domain protein [Coniochaeta sp. 2T2.1]